jgi:hypothetical protein
LHVDQLIAVKVPAGNGKALEHHIVEILIFAETRVAVILGTGRLLRRGLGIGEVDEPISATQRSGTLRRFPY